MIDRTLPRTSLSSGSIQHYSPVDFRPLPPVPIATPKEVAQALVNARAAQIEWESLPFKKRAQALKKAGKQMLVRRQEVLELLQDEVGKMPAEILLSEAVGPLQYIKDWTKVAGPVLKPRKLKLSPLAFPGKSGTIDALPRGVVGIITSWNYPLANFFKPVFAALLCGNAVLIKPSELSPRTADWFAAQLRPFLPAHTVQILQGGAETGEQMIRSGIDAVTFTGSYPSGKKVVALAAELMIPCSIELGGKDAAIVLADCDLDRTVAGVLHWALHNNGQACGDIERVFVEEAIADEFVSRLHRSMAGLRLNPSDPNQSDLGPCANTKQYETVRQHIEDAVSRGAKIVYGGKSLGRGLWIEPTLLDNCDPSMLVLQEPTFGPIIPIMRVKSGEAAVDFVNSCNYGLNASVWSADLTRAKTLARRLLVGTAFVNNHAFTGASPEAPWTGVKRTGYGIANSALSLQHYTRPRTLVLDRKKSPDAWWFPMNSTALKLGQSLAEAQLGNLRAALQLPFLISKREKQVRNYIQNPTTQNIRSLHSKLGSKLGPKPGQPQATSLSRPWFRLAGWTHFLLNRFKPSLSKRELLWARLAMEAAFAELPSSVPPKVPQLGAEQANKFLNDFYGNMPFSSAIAMRATFWFLGFSPIFKLGTFKTFGSATLEQRISIVQRMASSSNFLERQIALLVKMNGALHHATTTRFRDLEIIS